MARQHSKFRNILVIHLGQLGDVVLGLPALSAIREKFNQAHITLLLGKATGEIAKLARISDDHIVVDRVALRDGNTLRSIVRIFGLIREIRSRKFDLVIDLHSLSETNLLGFLSGAGRRLFANRENRSLDRLSNFRPRPPLEDKSKHVTDRYFDVLKPLDVDAETRAFRFRPDEKDLEYVQDRFFSGPTQQLDISIGLFPGAGNPSRRWSLENFAALANRLIGDGIRPVVILGPEEASLKESVKKNFPAGTVIIEGLTIGQFVAAVSKLDVFVANDTGPLHLAACCGVAIVLLLDGRAPMTYLPRAEAMRVVRGETIGSISVDQVYRSIENLMNARDIELRQLPKEHAQDAN